MRCRTDHVVVVALALLSGGACLDDGASWGTVRAELVIAFAPPAERLDDGRLKTARDYRVEVERIDVGVRALSLFAGAQGATFDPADPPSGYSLCHNGHCHSADGRLVPYAEIGGGSEGETIAAFVGGAVTLDDGVGAVAVPLSGCPPAGCDIAAPTRLTAVALEIERLEVTGRAFDPSGQARLPSEGTPFAIAVASSVIDAPLDAAFGPAERLGLAISARLVVPPHLFDDVDFAVPADGWTELVRGQLEEHAAITFELSRFD